MCDKTTILRHTTYEVMEVDFKRRISIVLLLGYLGIYSGRLALWQENDPDPSHIFPYPDQSYSDTDRELLRAGIPYTSKQELTGLMEDYFS